MDILNLKGSRISAVSGFQYNLKVFIESISKFKIKSEAFHFKVNMLSHYYESVTLYNLNPSDLEEVCYLFDVMNLQGLTITQIDNATLTISA